MERLPSECDLLLVADPSHLTYLAAFVPSPFVFRTVESSALLILEPNRATLVGDDMLGPFLDRAFVDEVVAPSWYDGNHSAPHRRRQLVESALNRLAGIRGKRLGVELSSVPAGVVEGLRSARPGLEILDIAPIIRTLRRSKDPDEIDVLLRSMRAGEKGQAAALEQIKPGMTELDAYRIVQNAAIDGARRAGHSLRRLRIRPPLRDRKGRLAHLAENRAGRLVATRFLGRRLGLSGRFHQHVRRRRGPTARQQELFDACVGALHAGEASLKPGVRARAVDSAVRGYFDSLNLAHAFTSHSGHGIGLGHPEPPYFVPNSDDTLVTGDVVALEPGLYIEGEGGMRFERNYVITSDGFRTLSHHEIRITQ